MENFKTSALLALLFLQCSFIWSQTSVTGTIINNETQEPLAGAHIIVVGTIQGTISMEDGTFNLSVNLEPPLTLEISYLGFSTQKVEISQGNTEIEVAMQEEAMLGQAVVISASRLKQSILKSPVSIEKMDIRFIQQAPTVDYYDALATKKGVQVSSSSLNFTSVNTRGFSDVGNSRFVQLLDGMDTSPPSINYNLGSIHALGELDIESLELLPGAGSALYGPNAFNGIMILTSKSPFEHQGLSVLFKQGITNSDAGGSNHLGSYSIRYAKAFNDKIAFKINGQFFDATDWTANDFSTDRNMPESTVDLSNEPDFDGVNLYGDETPLPVNNFGIGTLRRTGIPEGVLLDNNDAITRKFDAAVHYRINQDLELSGVYRFGGGRSVGQSTIVKLAWRDFTQQFYKLELKGDNFFLRGYQTYSKFDETFDIGSVGAFVNERFNPTIRPDGSGWIEDYVFAYLGFIPGFPASDHTAARTFADRFMIDPVTGEYTDSFQSVVNDVRTDDYQGNPPGASLFGRNKMTHFEGFYNFKEIEWADIIVGANFRRYSLFTRATTFDEAPVDPNNPERIKTDLFGIYSQVSKKFLEDFQFTGSIRYDKMDDFDGYFTPRISLVYSPNQTTNIRANYQTGFRIPDMIQQFVYFPTPSGIVLGGTPTVGGRYGVYNGGSWTQSSYNEFISQGGTIDPDTGDITSNPGNVTLETLNVPFLEAEEVSSFEIGFNSIIGDDMLIDLNYYHTSYTNFLGMQPAINKEATTHQGIQIDAGTLWSLSANSPAKIRSDGFGISLTYNLPNDFVVNGNYSYATFSGEQPEGFLTQFNTPENRFNIGLSNRKIAKNLGFGINYRYQGSFTWESGFGVADIPSYGVIDAQVNYKLPKLNTLIKVGGTNIGGDDYRTHFGGPFVGQVYYISLLYDEFLK